MKNLCYGLILSVLLCAAASAQIKVINMIPNSLSNEASQDSEGNLAVDLANPQRIAGSAFTSDPTGPSGTAPLYVSTDGGLTWTLNPILPSPDQTNDTTIRFGGTDGTLYSGILTLAGSGDMLVLRSADFTSSTLMSTIHDVPGPDQPFIQTTTVRGWYDPGKDRAYVGNNAGAGFGGSADSATVSFGLDAAAASPTFNDFLADNKTPVDSDAPSIRPAIHLDGTVYAAFMRWNSETFNAGTGEHVGNVDVVVVRDDNWGQGATPFTALMTGATQGVNVVSGRTVGMKFNHTATFGQERYGSDLSIAVDPNNHKNVYVAWGDRVSTEVITLHVRSSTTSGATWGGADLLTVTNAKNPALAVNSQGKLAFLYQALEPVAGSSHWVTHFRRLSGGTWDDTRLHSAPSNTPTADPFVGTYLGDYEYLMGVGKDYYGIFTGNNTPDKTNNFPDVPAANVIYQRNVNFATAQLRNATNTGNVSVSIDPFFLKSVELDPASDFYVRDWTDTATSFDTGLEPSTHQNFFSSSDVWNQYTNVAPAPGSFVQPTNSDARTSDLGDNYAFARISRNASGTSDTVSAHFMISNGGVGANFVAANLGAADPTVMFNAGDTQLVTPAFQWDIAAVNPNHHFCLAVQIQSMSGKDPFIQPTLEGLAPGWPNSDLNVINDNNKAQRNMSSTGITMGNHGGFSHFFVAHNAATEFRDMVIGYEADPAVVQAFTSPMVEVAGGEKKPFKNHDTLVLPHMAPGESRWIGFSAKNVSMGKTPLHVTFYEIVRSHPINGYTVELRPVAPEIAAREVFARHIAVFTRLSSTLQIAAAKNLIEPARPLVLENRKPTVEEHQKFFAGNLGQIQQSVQQMLTVQKGADPFGLNTAVSQITSAKGAPATVEAHADLLERLSANLTMLQLDRGDRADIRQMMAWQRDLFSRSAELSKVPAAAAIVRVSQKYIADWDARRARENEYPRVLRELLQDFRSVAGSVGQEHAGLAQAVDGLERELAAAPEVLEHAHREFLLRLDSGK